MRVVNIKTGLMYAKRYRITKRLTSKRLDLLMMTETWRLQAKIKRLESHINALHAAFEVASIIDGKVVDPVKRKHQQS